MKRQVTKVCVRVFFIFNNCCLLTFYSKPLLLSCRTRLRVRDNIYAFRTRLHSAYVDTDNSECEADKEKYRAVYAKNLTSTDHTLLNIQ